RARSLGPHEPTHEGPTSPEFNEAIATSAQEFSEIVRPYLSTRHFEIAEIIAMADNDLTIAISSTPYELLPGKLRATPRYHFATADQLLSSASFWTVEGQREEHQGQLEDHQEEQKNIALTVYDILRKCPYDGTVQCAPSGIYLPSDDLLPHLDLMKKMMEQLGSEALEQLCIERQRWTSSRDKAAQRNYRTRVTEMMVEKGLTRPIELF
ncbi:MAG TPA: hypothetical protein VJI15_06130, partial [Candidatus Nanoarchaeia archaeon]|nr:hypothetical protein [Candidatus Nanoarchaeia archaeon]